MSLRLLYLKLLVVFDDMWLRKVHFLLLTRLGDPLLRLLRHLYRGEVDRYVGLPHLQRTTIVSKAIARA